MIRVLGIAATALVVFLAAILVPLALSGRLSMDSFRQLAGTEEVEPPPSDPDAGLGDLARKLKAGQERLRGWEEELQERADRLDERERGLDQTLEEITALQQQVLETLDTLDADQLEAVQAVATSLERMEPSNAATDLESMTPEDAARLLPLIKDRTRGRILDAMNKDKRSEILQFMQARKY